MSSVAVRYNNIDQALKNLKRKMQREGTFREMKKRRHHIKNSELKVLKAEESMRRRRTKKNHH